MSQTLFTPIKLGDLELAHRLVMAPLTRYRSDMPGQIPNDMMATYYGQRASKGGLIITEATLVAEEAGGYAKTPGIWSAEQIAGWKKATDAVHAKGGHIYIQLWALGRTQRGETGQRIVSSGNIPDTSSGADAPTPEPLTVDEIEKYVGHWAQAAKNAVEAGFDGVEIHGAHGYLIDQFTQTTSNNRTDDYGGSIENRTRFALEVLEASVKAIGASKVAIRLSPYSTFQGMYNEDSVPTIKYLSTEIAKRFPDLAYVHYVESRADPKKVSANGLWAAHTVDTKEEENLDPFRAIFADTKIPFMSAGGYSPESAAERVASDGGLIAIGRHFISNPDLPARIKKGVPLVHYNRNTFYTHDAEGYTSYPIEVEA